MLTSKSLVYQARCNPIQSQTILIAPGVTVGLKGPRELEIAAVYDVQVDYGNLHDRATVGELGSQTSC